MCNYIFVNYECKPVLSHYLHSISSDFLLRISNEGKSQEPQVYA